MNAINVSVMTKIRLEVYLIFANKKFTISVYYPMKSELFICEKGLITYKKSFLLK